MSIIHKFKSIFPYLVFLFKRCFWTVRFNRNGNIFQCDGKLLKCSVLINGGGNSLRIEKGAYLNNCKISINGNNNTVNIGKGTRFFEGGYIRVEDNGNRVILHDDIAVSELFISVSDNDTLVEIGSNCLISSHVVIRTSDSHSIICQETGKRLNPGANVIIGNHCWLGFGATILKGTCIGADSVVATGAIIAGLRSPSNSIIAGIPAKVVKADINWNTKRL